MATEADRIGKRMQRSTRQDLDGVEAYIES